MKYIDADKLIAEIERWRDKAKENYNESTYSMGRCDALAEFRNHIVSLQQEQPDLPQIGYAETYYQKGLHDGIIKGKMEILKGHEEIEKRKAEPVLVIKEQEQQEVGLEKEIQAFAKLELEPLKIYDANVGITITMHQLYQCAKHFYSLGLAQK